MVHIPVEGFDRELYIANALHPNLQRVKVSVMTGKWDYVAIVSGLPGVGKSTFAQAICKFFDPTFDVDRICFRSREFIEKTTVGTKGQAFMLDESFADMNTSLFKDPEFIALINHMQLIRQNNLFLIIVLPDFFSLSKNIAIFRSSHLFVPYSVDYSHGSVAVFDREAKRELYIRGKQFCNYQAWEPNLRCDFQQKWFCNEEEYLKRKKEHLLSQSKVKQKENKAAYLRDMLAFILKRETDWTDKHIGEEVNQERVTVNEWVNRGQERYVLIKQRNEAV